MKRIISLVLCLIILATLPVIAHADLADSIKPDNSVVIAGITDEDVPVHGTLPHYNAGTAIVVIAPGQFQEISLTENGVETREQVEVAEQAEDEAVATKEEVDEQVELADADLNEQIFTLTNKERKNEGLKELRYNKDLQEAADTRARECALTFSHTRPDGSSCHTIVADMDYQVTGENLVKADTPIATADVLMEAWMNSEGHRANILLPEFTSMAVGTYEKDGTTYAVQIFLG